MGKHRKETREDKIAKEFDKNDKKIREEAKPKSTVDKYWANQVNRRGGK